MSWPVLARTAARLPGSRYRDDLALQASNGLYDARALLAHAREGRVGAAADFSPEGLAWFGHLVASEHESVTRTPDTVQLFELAYKLGGHRALGRYLNPVWIHTLAIEGKLPKYRHLFEGDGAKEALWAADVDAEHPSRGGDPNAWIELLNRPLVDCELAPVKFDSTKSPYFDAIRSRADGLATVSGPLITVIMPVYNPNWTLLTAVTSILNQTWVNLEVLLCDDASKVGLEILEEAEASDHRVKIVRHRQNLGAYAARNTGLQHARGKFITFNDADDWSHPERIERQYFAIQHDEMACASVSWCIQSKSDMQLTVVGRPSLRANLSSLMFPRNAIDSLGGFDQVRRGGDTEYIERYRALFGNDSIKDLREPLAFVQLTGGSLSRNDFRFLRTHPARLQYVATFRHWHRKLAHNHKPGVVPLGERAPFPAPAYITGTLQQTNRFDVVVAANFTACSPTIADLAAEVRALLNAGYRVGLVEALSPYDLHASVRGPSDQLLEAIAAGAEVLQPEQAFSAHLMLVRDPASIEAMPLWSTHQKCSTVVIAADYSPSGGRTSYDPQSAEARISGGESKVLWLPATPSIASEIVAANPTARIGAVASLGVVPIEKNSTQPPDGNEITVGVYLTNSRDPVIVRTVRAQLRAAITEANARPLFWRQRIPSEPEIGPQTPEADYLPTFVRECHMILVPRTQVGFPVLSPLLTRALASGKPVMLSTELADRFDSAVLDASYTSLEDAIQSLRNGDLERLATSARNWISKYLTDSSYLGALMPFLPRITMRHYQRGQE